MTVVRSFTIGTADDCDVRVHNDPYVSDRHAKVCLHDDGHITVEDLGSTNGTFLAPGGGPGRVRAWAPRRMLPGDTLWVGRTAIPWTADQTGQARHA